MRGRRGGTAVFLFLLASLLPLAELQARQAAGGDEPARLTLEEAIRRAEANNPGFRQVTNDLELNELDRRDAWLDLLPQPQLNLLSTNMSWSRQAVGEDFFGNPVEQEETGTVQTSRSNQSFGISFGLDLNDVLRLRQNEEQARTRELNVESEVEGLRADVGQAFLGVQEQQAVLALEEELLETAEANRDLVERLYALAQRDRIDLVSLELDLAEQENALDESRSDLETARLELRNLIGDPDLGAFEVEPEPLQTFDPEGLDPEALVRASRRDSPRVRQAEATLRTEERDVSMTRAEWLPTLTFNWQRSRQGFVQGGEAFFDPNPGQGWDQNLSFQVSLPDVGQYFRRRNEQARNDVAVRNAREGLRDTRNELEQEIRSLLNDLRSSHRSLEVQERRADLADERLELAREAYRLGQQSYLELQEAQQQSAEAQRQAVAAGFAFERARVALERAMGMPVEAMLDLGGEG